MMFPMMPTVSSFQQGESPVFTDSARPLDIPTFVQHYTGAEFVFASPNATLLVSDMTPVPTNTSHITTRERVNAAFSDALAGDRARGGNKAIPIVVGAVPFDGSAPAALSIARNYTPGGPLLRQSATSPDLRAIDTQRSTIDALSGASAQAEGVAMRVAREQPWPAPAVYEAAVADALARFKTGALGKVVLSRTLALQFDAPLRLPGLIQRLLQKNVHGYTYSVPVPTSMWAPVATLDRSDPAALTVRADRVFLGATPELLVRRVGRRVFLNPLAGSAARRLDPDEDQAVARALMSSAKDLQEHAIVIDAIAQVLGPMCSTLDVPSTPSLTSTDALWHLSTTIEGELADPCVTSLDLAFALHPTPAVCGYPVAAAQSAIAELEPFDRGLFAGFVGWIDANGDGEWAVSLRCAVCGPSDATLYAGAGIVPGSVPERETAETQTKFRTMLSALGLGGAIAAG